MKLSNLPELVKRVREGLGETQEEFAARFGMQTNAIYHLEKGHTKNINPDLVWWLLNDITFCETCMGAGFVVKPLTSTTQDKTGGGGLGKQKI